MTNSQIFFWMSEDIRGATTRVSAHAGRLVNARTHAQVPTGNAGLVDFDWLKNNYSSDDLRFMVRYEYNRRIWVDRMYLHAQSYPMLVSDRVYQAFLRRCAGSFLGFPVERYADDPGWKRAEDVPAYWAVYLPMGLSVRYELAGSIPREWYGLLGPARGRSVPLSETWSGADIFLAGTDKGSPACTEKVLHLAHHEKWTGFQFAPIGKRSEVNGTLNHLAKKWPPKSWFPPSPGEGKTFLEWLEIHRDASKTWEERRDAGEAIKCDYPDEAAAHFVERFLHGDVEARSEAAKWLFWLRRYVGDYEISAGVLDEAQSLVNTEMERQRRIERPDLYPDG